MTYRPTDLDWEVINSLKKLITALVKNAEHLGLTKGRLREIDDRNLSREGNRQQKGGRRVSMEPADRQTYYVLLIGSEDNGPNYLGSDDTDFRPPKRAIKFWRIEAIRNVLQEIGILSENELVESDQNTWVAFLESAVRVVEGRLSSLMVPKVLPAKRTLLPEPDWRLVQRAVDVRRVISLLKSQRAAAITGMSGSGKTLLAREVMGVARQQGWLVLEMFDAREALIPIIPRGNLYRSLPSRQRYESLYAGLWARVLASIAQELRNSVLGKRRAALLPAIKRFQDQWARSVGYGEKWRLIYQGTVNDEIEFLTALSSEADESPSWSRFADALIKHGRHFRNESLIESVAKVMTHAATGVLVVIDDVLSFSSCESIVTAFLGADQPSQPQSGPLKGPTLLITSQDQTCIDFLALERHGDQGSEVGSEEASNTQIDWDFAMRLVEAWSAPERGALTPDEAKAHISAFGAEHIWGKPSIRIGIQSLIDRLFGHPLALAALASSWRARGYGQNFWPKVQSTLDSKLLTINDSQKLGTLLAKRQRRVIQSLKFAWSLLGHVAAQRYLDLVIAPRGQYIDSAIFEFLWASTPRGDQYFDPDLEEKRPFRLFAELSLLQGTSRTGYFLHDLHRIMISEEIGNTESERHRLLLSIVGMLTSNDKLRPETCASLRPASGQSAQLRAISRYLARNLFHHVRLARYPEVPDEWPTQLVTCFRYLQARLDYPADDPSDKSVRRGDTDLLLRAFDGVQAKGLDDISFAIRSCSETLAADRFQLAGQLLARTSRLSGPWVIRLRIQARRHAEENPPVFIPMFPFARRHAEKDVAFTYYVQQEGVLQFRGWDEHTPMEITGWATDENDSLVLIASDLKQNYVLDLVRGARRKCHYLVRAVDSGEAPVVQPTGQMAVFGWRGTRAILRSASNLNARPLALYEHDDVNRMMTRKGAGLRAIGISWLGAVLRAIDLESNVELCRFDLDSVCLSARLLPFGNLQNLCLAFTCENTGFGAVEFRNAFLSRFGS